MLLFLSPSSHVLFPPHGVTPLPLLSFAFLPTPSPPLPSPPLSLHPPSIVVSQRHSQTGGGVKRWWAPGNPRGAFQWQGPQVKISRAAVVLHIDWQEAERVPLNASHSVSVNSYWNPLQISLWLCSAGFSNDAKHRHQIRLCFEPVSSLRWT